MSSISAWFSKLAPAKAYLGLEITDSWVKAAEVLPRKGRSPLVTKLVMERLPADTVEDGRIKNPLVLHHVINTLIQFNDFRTVKVHFVVPSSSIMVRYLKLPNLPDKQLRKVIDFEVKHHIHLPFEQPYYDFVNLSAQWTPPVIPKAKKNRPPKNADPETAWKEAAAASETDSHILKTADSLFSDLEPQTEAREDAAPQADVMLVAAPKELVDQYAELLRNCGLQPCSAEIKALALFRFINSSFKPYGQETLLTVDVNQSAADISIFHEGNLKITRNVLVTFPAADQPKPQNQEEQDWFASFADPDADFQNACSDLAHELERLMNFYRYSLNNRSQEFHNLLLSGDIERLEEVAVYLKDRLNQQVKLLHSDSLDKSDHCEAERLYRYAIPIGLGLRGNEA